MKTGMQQATYPLDEGEVYFQWPKAISEESKEELETWIDLIRMKIKRSVIECADEDKE